MIKVKIYRTSYGHRKFENRLIPVSDYCYCVYFLGILIHSITLVSINDDSVDVVFGGKKIIERNEAHQR